VRNAGQNEDGKRIMEPSAESVQRDIIRAIIASDEEWRDYSACLRFDPEWWFPVSEKDSCIPAAKAVCATCPVATRCEQAGAAETFGIWAGVLKRSAEQLRSKRRATAARDGVSQARAVVAAHRHETVSRREARRAAAAEVVTRLYRQGTYSIKACATVAGVGTTMARTILAEAGIEIRERGVNARWASGRTGDASLTSS
jgi:hypothetical protein